MQDRGQGSGREREQREIQEGGAALEGNDIEQAGRRHATCFLLSTRNPQSHTGPYRACSSEIDVRANIGT